MRVGVNYLALEEERLKQERLLVELQRLQRGLPPKDPETAKLCQVASLVEVSELKSNSCCSVEKQ